MSVRGSSMSMPSTTTLPDDGSSSRFRQRSRVDLPEPDGPITNTSSRSATRRSTPFSTCRAPKCLWSPRASTIGPFIRLGSATVQLVRRRVVAGHARRAVARRDHDLEIVGRRLSAEPLLGELGDGPVLLHAVERVLQLGAKLRIVLRHRSRPVGARIL